MGRKNGTRRETYSRTPRAAENLINPIEICVNRQSQNYITIEDLLGLINHAVFDEQHSIQIYNLFTEVPLQMIVKLFLDHQIDEAVFKKYYITYIQPIYPNKELEEMLAYVSI
ncbi:MAG TPA: hypothetical protein GXX58_10080 [Gelria sp.]|jgi:hypothetical protein|nr:hypothetical protein [Gelria sp.]